MGNQLNSINSIEPPKQLSKSKRFVENTKRAVRKVLTSTWIAASTMWPMATTTTATFVPASVNTISVVAPTASTVAKAISLWTAASLLTACGGEDWPDDPINVRDTTPPTININKSEVDITWWKEIRINGSQLYIWSELVASRNDNKTRNCIVSLSINWKTITSWTTISEEWTLTIKVSDEAWNIKNSDVRLNIDKPVSWLESLKNISLQVDQEVNLLKWISFWNEITLVKVQIEKDWQIYDISDPQHYIPDYPWECNIILIIKDKDNKVTEYKVDNLTIKPLDYKTIEIKNIKPVDILPIIWQVEVGDKQVYEHIEHLRIAEATRIRDMMREYGAGNHSAEEYQNLMMRLNTGMTLEHPLWYDNYEIIWWWIISSSPSEHAHTEWSLFDTLIKHSNLKVVDPRDWERYDALIEFINNNQNSINIFWNSSYWIATNKSDYDLWLNKQRVKDLCNLNNFIIFAAGTNIETEEWYLRNKIYNGEYEADEHGRYSLASMANSDKNTQPHSHLLVTIATNKNGNIDQTNETYESSKFPIWFKDNILFSGRAFPRHSTNWWWRIEAEWSINGWKYATSHTNYLNVAIACILFQLKADTPDADQLLEMIRSTALTDYIRFDLNGDGDTNDTYQGQTENQPLLLMNPTWFIKKYLMPTDLPSSIQSSKTVNLNKWYYKWVIFDIPWAEVKINWEWITYNDANKSQIKNQNPMTLERRLNGDLCRKLWYKWQTIQWKIIVVDDKWNGLNIDKDFSENIQ